MMNNELPIKVADGQITEWHGIADRLTVSLLDWQEKSLLLTFLDVAAVIAMAPIGVDLSHLETSDEDPLLTAARETGDEDSILVAFRFISAWENKAVLTVIASSIASDSERQAPHG